MASSDRMRYVSRVRPSSQNRQQEAMGDPRISHRCSYLRNLGNTPYHSLYRIIPFAAESDSERFQMDALVEKSRAIPKVILNKIILANVTLDNTTILFDYNVI